MRTLIRSLTLALVFAIVATAQAAPTVSHPVEPMGTTNTATATTATTATTAVTDEAPARTRKTNKPARKPVAARPTAKSKRKR